MANSYDLTTLKRHAYLVTYGETVLGPLSDTPQIEADTDLQDCLIYENGKEAVAQYLNKNQATVTVTTKNIAGAMALLKDFQKGDNVMDTANRKPLTFTPIVEGEATEKTLVFGNACLQPGISYVPASGEDHTAKLVFRCLPDAETGVLFTYA